jgi:hypothetical protein
MVTKWVLTILLVLSAHVTAECFPKGCLRVVAVITQIKSQECKEMSPRPITQEITIACFSACMRQFSTDNLLQSALQHEAVQHIHGSFNNSSRLLHHSLQYPPKRDKGASREGKTLNPKRDKGASREWPIVLVTMDRSTSQVWAPMFFCKKMCGHSNSRDCGQGSTQLASTVMTVLRWLVDSVAPP